MRNILCLLSIVDIIYSIIFFLTFIVDIATTRLIIKQNILISNSYIVFHLKYGLIKTNIFKFIIMVWLIYGLLGYSIKSGAIMTIITGYTILVVKLLITYHKETRISKES